MFQNDSLIVPALSLGPAIKPPFVLSSHSFIVFSFRFAPTRTPNPWDGTRVADKFSPVCPQRLPNILNETAALEKMPKGRLEYLKRLLPFLQNQSEDCLYLNIFAPLHGKFCVQFFIHSKSTMLKINLFLRIFVDSLPFCLLNSVEIT